MRGRTDSAAAAAQTRSEEMDPDVFLTIAFVLYAAMGAAITGLLIAHNGRDTVDQAAENRFNGSVSTTASGKRPRTSARVR
jgi:hypothetical protein